MMHIEEILKIDVNSFVDKKFNFLFMFGPIKI